MNVKSLSEDVLMMIVTSFSRLCDSNTVCNVWASDVNLRLYHHERDLFQTDF